MITRFADEIDQTVATTDPMAWKNEVATDFGENAWAMAKQTGRERLAVSGMVEELRHRPGVEINPSAAEVSRNMLREGKLTPEEVAFAWEPAPEWEDSAGQYNWDKIGEYIRMKDPEAKLDLRTERLVRRNEVIDALRAKETEITDRASFAGQVGQFAGAMPMYMIDPPNIVAMAASPWTSAVGASRTVQYASVAAEQLLTEVVTIPSVAEHRESLGLEYSSAEKAMDIAMSVLGGVGIKGLFDAGSAIKGSIKQLKASPAVGTVEGQKTLGKLMDADAEVEIAKMSGRPLNEVLDDTDKLLTDVETPLPARDVADPESFPEVRPYDQDTELQTDFETMIASRPVDAEGKPSELIPISAHEVDGKIEVEYKSKEELFSEFDTEIEKTYKARACFGI